MRTLDYLRRECQIKGETKINQIPCYIGRAIAHDFNWTHDIPPFQKANLRDKVKAFFKWRKQKCSRRCKSSGSSPSFSFEEILEAILEEAYLFTEQIDHAQEAYLGEPDFDLRSYLGEFYTEIIEVFVSLSEVVSAYQVEDFSLAKKHEKHLRNLIGGKICLSNLCRVLESELEELLDHFRKPIIELEKVGKEATQSLKSFSNPKIDIKLDSSLTDRKYVYFKPDKLESNLYMMMHNSTKHGDANNIKLRFFGEYKGWEISNNYGFYLEDDGDGFYDVRCLTESYSAISFAKEEYLFALVIVESRGDACWYHIHPVFGITLLPECKAEHEETRITLILPVDHGEEFIWNILKDKFNEREMIANQYNEADKLRYRKGKQAIRRLNKILELTSAKTDPFSRNKTAQCHHLIGNCFVHEGNLEKALNHHQKAEDLVNQLFCERKLDPPYERLWLYNSRSVYYTDCYDFETAEKYLKRSIEGKERMYEPFESLAQNWGSLGQLYTFWGRYDEAEAVLLKAVSAMEDTLASNTQENVAQMEPEDLTKLTMDTARDRNYLAMLYIKMGKFEEAKKIFQENLNLIDSVPIAERKPGQLIYVYYGLSNLYYHWGIQTKDNTKFQRAKKVADQGLDLYSSGFPYPGALICKFKGCAHRELQEWDEAVSLLKKSYNDFETDRQKKNFVVIGATARLELAKLYLKRNHGDDLSQACVEIEHALRSLKAFDIPSAKEYFSESIQIIKTTTGKLSAGNVSNIEDEIQKVIDKIPY